MDKVSKEVIREIIEETKIKFKKVIKEIRKILGVSLKNQTVETHFIKVHGNCLEFKETILQLSNISLFSTGDVSYVRKPYLSLFIVIAALVNIFVAVIMLFKGVGFFGFLWHLFISLVCLAVGLCGISFWYNRVQERKKMKKLSIITNSGNVFTIVFKDRDFLNDVVEKLTETIANPTGHGNITINVQENTFQDSAIVNELNDYSTSGKE